MARLELYHGSTNIVREPMFGKGRPDTDYGQGFYCTESLELAKEWACKQGTSGFANRYLIDTDNLSILDLSMKEFSPINWIAILLKHRDFELMGDRAASRKESVIERYYIDTSAYDLVKGYRADDSYFLFASYFIDGLISYEKLTKALLLGDLGIQIVLKSRKSFDMIKFQDAVSVQPDQYLNSYIFREERANQKFREITGGNSAGTYIDDILDGRADP